MSSIWRLAFDIWDLAFDIWHQSSQAWYFSGIINEIWTRHLTSRKIKTRQGMEAKEADICIALCPMSCALSDLIWHIDGMNPHCRWASQAPHVRTGRCVKCEYREVKKGPNKQKSKALDEFDDVMSVIWCPEMMSSMNPRVSTHAKPYHWHLAWLASCWPTMPNVRIGEKGSWLGPGEHESEMVTWQGASGALTLLRKHGRYHHYHRYHRPRSWR